MPYEAKKLNDKPFSVTIRSEAYQNLINNTLGDKEVARKFVADIMSVVSNNTMLQNCDAGSIISAGLIAQSLNLSLAPAIGHCYIVPYGGKAQYLLSYKGLIQLCERSGQFQRLGVRAVHEGEYKGQDEFGDDEFAFSHDFDSKPVVGYYSYFVLNNGFKKTLYMTVDQLKDHARKYSKSYESGKSTDLWSNSFDTMASKTCLKLLLSRYAPMSVDMQKAIQVDQAVIEDNKAVYVDNNGSSVEIIADENGEVLNEKND